MFKFSLRTNTFDWVNFLVDKIVYFKRSKTLLLDSSRKKL